MTVTKMTGGRLVPEEPTEAMVNAALLATAGRLDIPGSQLTVNREKVRIRYKAMLAMAPSRHEQMTALSRDELLDAANIMETMADGHCSIGMVSEDVAKHRRRVADWLKELAGAEEECERKAQERDSDDRIGDGASWDDPRFGGAP